MDEKRADTLDLDVRDGGADEGCGCLPTAPPSKPPHDTVEAVSAKAAASVSDVPAPGASSDRPRRHLKLVVTLEPSGERGYRAVVAVGSTHCDPLFRARQAASFPHAHGGARRRHTPPAQPTEFSPRAWGGDLTRLNQVLVDRLALLPRAGLPGSDRARVQAECRDDALAGTAVAEEREDERHGVPRRAEPIVGRPFGHAEGLAAASTLVAPLFPCPTWPPHRTGRIVAELLRGVPEPPPANAMESSRSLACIADPSLSTNQPPHHALVGCYR